MLGFVNHVVDMVVGIPAILTAEQAGKSVELGRVHLQVYNALAAEALQEGRLLWKLRPKSHYMHHLLDEVERCHTNPMGLSNFLDEDHMQYLRGVAIRCHPSTARTSWARRRIAKRERGADFSVESARSATTEKHFFGTLYI